MSAASWHNMNIRGSHDNVAPYVHWHICGKAELEQADKRYKHTPERVAEREGFKVLWDFNVPFDRVVEAQRLHIVFGMEELTRPFVISYDPLLVRVY